jgi:hypothetical protein
LLWIFEPCEPCGLQKLSLPRNVGLKICGFFSIQTSDFLPFWILGPCGQPQSGLYCAFNEGEEKKLLGCEHYSVSTWTAEKLDPSTVLVSMAISGT